MALCSSIHVGIEYAHAGEGRQHEDELVKFVSYPSDTCEEFSPLIVLFRLPVITGLGFVTQGI